MRSSSTSLCMLSGIIIFLMLINFVNVTEGQNMTYVGHACNENTWGDNNDYAELVVEVLDEAVYGAPADPTYADYETASYGDYVAFGFGACSDAILMYECYDCLRAARAQLTARCGDAIGGEVQLADCKIRYENYDFYP